MLHIVVTSVLSRLNALLQALLLSHVVTTVNSIAVVIDHHVSSLPPQLGVSS
jgi:hypothetical protein